ncbi:hypothetical protein MiTs_01406 [Microcystis aeruginosa NIES-2521]|uniref:PEP-CTERM protein-sorting domain-containing protein n=3 Tax=Microcystis TaxID=1125 RepID=A0A5A5RWI3_MICAE|nr:hypothetical protein MiTs_01406 [Microcystis aeruginosa NIES-2521]
MCIVLLSPFGVGLGCCLTWLREGRSYSITFVRVKSMIAKHKKLLSLSSTALVGLSVFTPAPASAAIARFFGWKFSDREIYQDLIQYADAAGVICGLVPIPAIGCTVLVTGTTILKIVDPPPTEILSGRVTIDFDPSNELLYAGWYGEFGANPLLPAPPVDGSTFDQNLLQFNSNPAMVSSSINIDQTNGRVVFEFDWGSTGFIPTLNLDAQGHFNILGMYFLPSSPVPDSLIGTSPNPLIGTIVGSLEDIQANGTNASSYLQCRIRSENGGADLISYCGETVPEPTSILSLLALGTLGAASTLKRQLKSSKSTEKETTKVS